MSSNFDRWIEELRDDVIQGEYGHAEGEYTVCPDVWRSLYDHGMTPSQAFRFALGANAKGRERDDAERLAAHLARRSHYHSRRPYAPLSTFEKCSPKQDAHLAKAATLIPLPYRGYARGNDTPPN